MPSNIFYFLSPYFIETIFLNEEKKPAAKANDNNTCDETKKRAHKTTMK